MGVEQAEINTAYDDADAYDGRYPPDWDTRRIAVLQRDSYTCSNCGVRSGPYGGDSAPPLHVHHVVPLSDGGSNRLSNLTTLCESCHNDAHDHDITENIESPSSSTTTARSDTSDGIIATLIGGIDTIISWFIRLFVTLIVIPLGGMLIYTLLLAEAESLNGIVAYAAIAIIVLLGMTIAWAVPGLTILSYVGVIGVLYWSYSTGESSGPLFDPTHSTLAILGEIAMVFAPLLIALISLTIRFRVRQPD